MALQGCNYYHYQCTNKIKITIMTSKKSAEIQAKKDAWHRTKYEYEVLPIDQEHPKGESKTIPDDSYTIREILDRHTRGLSTSMSNKFQESEVDMTHDDIDLEELARADIAEREELVKATEERIRNLKGSIERDRQERITKLKEAYYKKHGKTMDVKDTQPIEVVDPDTITDKTDEKKENK